MTASQQSELVTETRRKGTQSLYNPENPLAVERRARVESHYTARSGEKVIDDQSHEARS